MPRCKSRHVEKPWIRDPEVLKRWQELIDEGKGTPKQGIPNKPSNGWQLWDWRTLEDKPQE